MAHHSLHLTHTAFNYQAYSPHKTTFYQVYHILHNLQDTPHLQYTYTPNSTLIYTKTTTPTHCDSLFHTQAADDDRRPKYRGRGRGRGRGRTRGRARGNRGGGPEYTFHFYQPDTALQYHTPPARPHPYYSWTPNSAT